MSLLITSCEQATLLVDKRADGRLPLAAAATLAVHLAYCPYCRRYAAQSPLVSQLALFTAQRAAVRPDVRLRAEARARIQQRLDAAQRSASH